MNNFYLIGLVGNLGSGKSTVRKILEQLGARGIDADALAHVVMQRGSPTWRAIVAAFGIGILQFNGRIDRRKLGAQVFSDPGALKKLEAITHPAVGKAIRDLARENKKPVVVIEAVKLVEAGMHLWCDELWAVDCAPAVALARVMRSRNTSEQETRARLAAQGSLAEKKRLAQVVINNSGELDATRAQVEKAWQAIHPETARDKTDWLLGLRVEEKSATLSQPVIESPIVETPPPIQTAELIAPLPTPVAPKSITVRRSRRNDLDALAVALAKKDHLPASLSPEETLKRFGEHGYRIAVADNKIVALIAWEAENLVASINEIWAESAAAALAIPRLLELVDGEASALLCEVVLLMIEESTPNFITTQLAHSDYQPQDLATLPKVWQGTVRERLHPGAQLWGKKLSERIMTKPF